MRAFLIASTILVAVCGQAADLMEFVDEWTAGDLIAYGQRRVPLVSVMPTSMVVPRGFTGTVRYASIAFHDAAWKEVPIVCALVADSDAAPVLYVDGNADGILGDAEKAAMATPEQRPPGFVPDGQTVWIAEITRPFAYTAAFAEAGFGYMLGCALRGYTRAEVPTDGGHVVAVFVDRNADMSLRHSMEDAYIDVNGDGRFDPATERFEYAGRIDAGPVSIAIDIKQPMQEAYWSVADTTPVPVRFCIASIPGRVKSILATVANDAGDVFRVESFQEPVMLPPGDYQVESLILEATCPDGSIGKYTFTRMGTVPPKQIRPPEAVYDLIGEMSVNVSYSSTPARGEKLYVRMLPRTATSLDLNSATSSCDPLKTTCTSCGTGAIPAVLTLIGPDGQQIARVDPMQSSCCGYMGSGWVTMPPDAPAGTYTLRVSFNAAGLGQTAVGEKTFELTE